MPTREDEQGLISPTIIAPTRMLEFRMPSLALDPRGASDCRNVTIKNGILKKRTGFQAFSIDDHDNTNITGKIQGLYQTPFGWTNDIVALAQGGTYTRYWLYHTSADDWHNVEQTAQTEYSQLSACPAVKSDGTEVVILADGKVRLKIWDDSQVAAADKIAAHTTNSTVLRAKIVRYFWDHLCLFNVGTYASSWTQETRKIQWMNAADCEDDDGGDSGDNSLLGRTGGIIVGAEELSNDMFIYCEHEIIRMAYVGGTSVYRFDPIVSDRGIAAQNAIVNLGDRHLFLADDFTIQEFCGNTYCRPVGDPINSDIQDNINKTYYANSFAVRDKGLNEAWFFIPTTTATPDLVYVIKYGGCVEDYCWYKDDKSALCAMEHDNWTVLAGTGTPTIDYYDHSDGDDGASAIDGYWDSISFVVPGSPASKARHSEIRFEAKGGEGDTVSTYYSTDEGSNWTKIDDHTLTSNWSYYSAPFDPGYVRSVQFRFRNNTADETFEIKWWQPVFLPAGVK